MKGLTAFVCYFSPMNHPRIPKNEYNIPLENLSEAFYDFLEKLLSSIYIDGFLNEYGQKIVFNAQVSYNFGRVKHLIEALATKDSSLTGSDMNHITALLDENFVRTYKRSIATHKIPNISAEQSYAFFDTVHTIVRTSTTMNHIATAKQLLASSNLLSETLQLNTNHEHIIRGLNKKAAHVRFGIPFQQDGFVYCILNINSTKHLYNLSTKTLISSIDEHIIKRSVVYGQQYFQYQRSRSHTEKNLTNLAKTYGLTTNHKSVGGLLDYLLGNSFYDEDKKQIIVEAFLEQIQKGGTISQEDLVEALLDEQNLPIFIRLIAAISFKMQIMHRSVGWTRLEGNELHATSSIYYDEILTKMRTATYQEKPGIQYVVQKNGNYFVIIANNENHTEIAITEEDFMELYNNKDSGWEFF